MSKTLVESARQKAAQLMSSYGYSPALNAEVAKLLRELAATLERAENERSGMNEKNKEKSKKVH